MHRENALWLALGGAGLLWLFSRTETGSGMVQSAVDSAGDLVTTVQSSVRGLRNNNPGNIRRDTTGWQGLSPSQNDPEFFQFAGLEWGVRAIAVILNTYSKVHGLDTITGIISRWAPPQENNTPAYIAAVSASTGFGADDELNMSDPSVIFALVRAIMAQENGRAAAALVPDDTVSSGIALA